MPPQEKVMGRDPATPRQFVPHTLRSKYKSWSLLFEDEDSTAAPILDVHMTSVSFLKKRSKHDLCLTGLEPVLLPWKVDLDVEMTMSNDELRQLAQKHDSDDRDKEWGAVVGGEAALAFEEIEVRDDLKQGFDSFHLL
jgi:hypothetical protein